MLHPLDPPGCEPKRLGFGALLRVTVLAVVLALSLTTAVQSAGILPLAAKATNTGNTFRDYVRSFGLPGPVDALGISGSISIRSHANAFSEALFVLSAVPSGSCPTASDWHPQNEPDLIPIGIWIIKGSGAGLYRIPINFMLPVGIPISGCLVLEFDGGGRGTDGGVTMASDLALVYGPASTSAPAPSVIPVGGEVCFGASLARSAIAGAGCAALDSPVIRSRPEQAYASVYHVTHPTKLLAAIGSISSAAFSGPPLLDPPTTNWSTFGDTFVLRGGCPRFPAQDGFYGPGNYYASIPRTTADILSTDLNASGQGTAQRPIFRTFSGLMLRPGDCIVHVMAAYADGGVDAEDQIYFIGQPSL